MKETKEELMKKVLDRKNQRPNFLDEYLMEKMSKYTPVEIIEGICKLSSSVLAGTSKHFNYDKDTTESLVRSFILDMLDGINLNPGNFNLTSPYEEVLELREENEKLRRIIEMNLMKED